MAETMKLLVNTPDRVFYEDADVTMVELATSEGEIGVFPQHIPLTSVVVPCVLKIHHGNEVDSGDRRCNGWPCGECIYEYAATCQCQDHA